MDFPFSFNPKSGLLLIFFFHGVVFSFLLIKKSVFNLKISQRLLGFLVLLCSLYIVPYMLGYAGWYGNKTTSDILFFIPFMQVLFIGPVVYFYIESLLFSNFKFTRKDWLHFIPGIIYLLYSFIVFVTDKFILDDYFFYADGRDKDLKTWYQLLGLSSMIIYLIISLKNYLSYKKAIYEVVSYADSILFKWIQNFLIAFLLLLIIRIIFFFSNPQWEEFGSQFWYFISFSLIFYYISITGYTQSVKSTSLNQTSVNHESLEEIENQLGSIEIEKWKPKIIALLENERVFENPQLTLSDVAKKLETTTKTVSKTINMGFNMNFNDFINQYRVEALKEKIYQKQHLKTTLLGLALDCGFNSKATFNRAFKKSTSQTPKDFIANLK